MTKVGHPLLKFENYNAGKKIETFKTFSLLLAKKITKFNIRSVHKIRNMQYNSIGLFIKKLFILIAPLFQELYNCFGTLLHLMLILYVTL